MVFDVTVVAVDVLFTQAPADSTWTSPMKTISSST